MATLNAKKRNCEEKLKKLRGEGYIPGVLYGKDLKESVPVQFEKPEVVRFLNSHWTGSKAEINLDGQTYSVLLKETEVHPVTRVPVHLSFLTLPSAE